MSSPPLRTLDRRALDPLPLFQYAPGLAHAWRRERRRVARGALVIGANRPAAGIYAIDSGWAILERTLQDGRRHVLDFLLPGDLFGLDAVFLDYGCSDVTALTDASVACIPQTRLTRLIAADPRLSATILQMQLRTQAMLDERLVTVGRRTAAERVAHLLVELWCRLRRRGLARGLAYELPASQSLLADVLGLSTVHLNRSLQQLRRRGLVEVRQGRVDICDLRGLMSFACFDDAYLHGT
jgi:CRP-like cAMP-binding protein